MYNTVRFGIPSVCGSSAAWFFSVWTSLDLPIPPVTAQQHDVPMPSSLNFAVCSSSILAEALCLFSPFGPISCKEEYLIEACFSSYSLTSSIYKLAG